LARIRFNLGMPGVRQTFHNCRYTDEKFYRGCSCPHAVSSGDSLDRQVCTSLALGGMSGPSVRLGHLLVTLVIALAAEALVHRGDGGRDDQGDGRANDPEGQQHPTVGTGIDSEATQADEGDAYGEDREEDARLGDPLGDGGAGDRVYVIRSHG
jgi:hypothetical protein